MADIADLKKVIVLTAMYYGRQIDMGVLTMMAEDFEGYDPEKVIVAYGAYRKNPKNKTFPLPAQIMEILNPKISERDVGNDVAGRIWSAIPEFGYMQPNEAKAHLGELAWKVVERMGGWVNLCSSTTEDNRGIFMAQARDMAESVHRLSSAGLLDHKHELPGLPRTGTEDPKSLGSILKLVQKDE